MRAHLLNIFTDIKGTKLDQITKFQDNRKLLSLECGEQSRTQSRGAAE